MAKLKSIPLPPASQPEFVDGEPLVAYRSIDDATFAIGAIYQKIDAGGAELPPDLDTKRSRHVYDRIDHLMTAMTHMQATSPSEAVSQICVLYNLLDDLAHPELITGTDKEDPEFVRERVRRKVDRLLYSLLGWVHTAHCLDVETFVHQHMPESANPWSMTGD